MEKDSGLDAEQKVQGTEVVQIIPFATDPFIAAILRDRTLRGESKLCWIYLWHKAGRRPGIVHTSATQIGADLGKSERSVSRWLEKLEARKLVRFHDRLKTGWWQIYIAPPTRSGRREPDPQKLLFNEKNGRNVKPAADMATTVTADVATQPPRHNLSPPQSLPANRMMSTADLSPKPPWHDSSSIPACTRATMVPFKEDNLLSPNPGNLGTLDHGTMGEPKQIATLLPEAIEKRINSPEKLRRLKNALVNYLVKAIGDPDMDLSIPRRAADAVIEFRFNKTELENIAEATQRKRLAGEIRVTPRAYFMARCQKAGMPGMQYTKPKRESR